MILNALRRRRRNGVCFHDSHLFALPCLRTAEPGGRMCRRHTDGCCLESRLYTAQLPQRSESERRRSDLDEQIDDLHDYIVEQRATHPAFREAYDRLEGQT